MQFSLESVLGEVSGVWDTAQAALRVRLAEGAAARGDWAAATRHLMHVSGLVEDASPRSPVWRELAVATMGASVQTDDAELVERAAAQVLSRTWIAERVPDELLDAFRGADRDGRFIGGRALGEALTRRFPRWPYGFYAAAHFWELAARAGADGSPPASAVHRFRRAARLFAEEDDPSSEQHCLLRAAVLSMEHAAWMGRGRELLRAIDRSTLAEREELWHAYALAQSPFWLDRVRALDFVVDAREKLDRVDASHASSRAADVDALCAALFAHLPLQLQPMEADRLHVVVEATPEPRRWQLEAQLQGRIALAPHADTPLDALSTDAARALAQDALPLSGFMRLITAWRGEDSAGPSPRCAVVAGVEQCLLAVDEEHETLRAHLHELVAAVVATTDDRALTPVSLVFARLCDGEVATELCAPLTELALHFVSRAPRPSFGFASLSDAFFASKLDRAGAAAARRALEEGETIEARLRRDLVGRSMQWAVREGSDREMLWWLETGSAEPRT